MSAFQRHGSAILWCLFIGLAAPAAAAADLAATARAIDAPALGREITVAGPVRVGHGTITYPAGTMGRLLVAGNRVCGLYIGSPGRLSYAVADRFSIPVARRNLDADSRLWHGLKNGALVAGEDIEAAVIWRWRDGNPTPAAGTGVLPEKVTRMFRHPFFSPPSHLLIEEARLGGHGAVYAILLGTKDDLLIVADPVEDRAEYLYRIRRITDSASLYRGRYFVDELAAQPLGRAWADRFPAPLVATREAIEVDNDRGSHVTVRTATTLVATRPHVALWNVPLVDEHAGPTRLHPITVSSVTVNGRPAGFLHQGSELLVALDPPLRRGEKVTVHVEHGGDLAIPPGNDSYWWLGTWPWYPQPPLNGEFATIEMSVRTPKPFIPFASGAVVARGTKDGHAFIRTRLDRPSQFPVAAAGKYHVYSRTHDGVTCDVASYVFGKRRACMRLIKDFFAASSYYAKLFDAPWPYPNVQVVEVNTWGFGQAPPGVIFITKEAFEPLLDSFNQYFSAGVNERFVHEVAHAWWGHRLMMDSLDEQWLTESFAEYSAALFLQAAHGGGRAGAKEFRHILDGWRARAKQIGPGGSIFLANHLAGSRTRDFVDRTYLLYARGPLVIHAIRLRLRKIAGGKKKGDALFVTLLRSFLKNCDFRWGATTTLMGILRQMTGRDWRPFFDRYVFGTETPRV